MYQPKKYRKTDPEYIFKFIQEHPLATMVLQGNRMLATHVPMLTEGEALDFRLFSHIANHNELIHFLRNGMEVLLIFQGVDGYVSSSWYDEKDISTWDYSAVHINALVTLQSPAELEESLEKLVNHFEQSQENPLFYKDIPRSMIEEHLPLITGFWCQPYKIEAVAKLHQGFSRKDVNSVTQHLEQLNQPLSLALSQTIRKEHGTNH